MFDFAARLVRVIDGDTVVMEVDVGFRLKATQRIRLANIDTPERTEPGWREATLGTITWFAEHRALRVTTYVEDTFGRWVADVYDPSTGDSLSEVLLRLNLATVWR